MGPVGEFGHAPWREMSTENRLSFNGRGVATLSRNSSGLANTGPDRVACNNSSMFRHLQARADVLAESLLVAELELRRIRSLASRMQAFFDFEIVTNQIDALRRDAESFHAAEKDALLDDLDRKITAVMRSAPYRIASWFATDGAELSWLIAPESAYPLGQLPSC
jgi:hypothetical protein